MLPIPFLIILDKILFFYFRYPFRIQPHTQTAIKSNRYEFSVPMEDIFFLLTRCYGRSKCQKISLIIIRPSGELVQKDVVGTASFHKLPFHINKILTLIGIFRSRSINFHISAGNCHIPSPAVFQKSFVLLLETGEIGHGVADPRNPCPKPVIPAIIRIMCYKS